MTFAELGKTLKKHRCWMKVYLREKTFNVHVVALSDGASYASAESRHLETAVSEALELYIEEFAK